MRAAHTGSGPDVRGWGVELDNRRHFDETVTALSAATLADLELKWAFAYPDALRARSQPAIMGDTLFVGGQDGSVFALDKRTGCMRWRFQTVAEVRTGIVIGPRDGPGERGLLYVGTGENYSSPANAFSDAIVALRLDTGAIAWHRQMTAGDAWNMGCETAARINCPPEDGPDFDFGAATIIARDGEGRDVLLAGQKSGHVYALDLSRRGALRWRRKLGRGGIQGGVHFGMAVHGQTLYVPMSDFDGGPRWPGIARPGMFAVDISSGETLWYTAHADRCRGRAFCQPGISAAATSIPGAVLGGAMDGVLRAYAADTGKVVWSFDTAREFAATHGGAARGGSMGGASGAVPSGDMLFVNSGYGIYFHMPGAALLAFGPKD